jgi:hypothetical protein
VRDTPSTVADKMISARSIPVYRSSLQRRPTLAHSACPPCTAALMFKVMWASWNQSYLDLCGNDTGKMAVHYGWCRVGMGLCHIVTNPLYSAISDSVGRKHMMAWGRIGWMWFFFMHKFRDRSLQSRLLHEWVRLSCLRLEPFPQSFPRGQT